MQRTGTLTGPGLGDLLDLLMEPTPATYVRQVLCLYRQRGWEFEQAWAQAMRTLPRYLPEIGWWRENFHAQKERWRAAYDAPTASGVLVAA